MTGTLTPSPKKGKRKSKLIVRLMIPMMLLVVFQVATFFGILIVGGEFDYVREYAYRNLVEKTENRRNYVESQLQQKIPVVMESTDKINDLVANILSEQGATIADLQADRALNNLILESSVDTLVELLRRSSVNDVYLILETGSLYSQDGGSANAKAALYLRDLDIMTDAGYEDLLMEMGLTSISRSYGIVTDSGWTLHFEPDLEDLTNFGFYLETIASAKENPSHSAESLARWTSFSKHSRSAAASIKYSVPLIAKDGTVYGILGIGLTENTVLSNLPANDFMSEVACYVLGMDNGNGVYSIITHSGTAYQRLLGNTDTLRITGTLTDGINDFDTTTGVELAGSVQPIELYNVDTPHDDGQWALISVAERSSVLSPLNNMINMLLIAAVISVLVSAVIVIFSARVVSRPMARAVKTMNASMYNNQIIHFEPSHIEEFDRMTDAITQLQINVQDFSSQVSQMIRIADVGLGTFMYDRSDDTVFVGQSLLNLLRVPMEREEDVIMTRKEFLDDIVSEETKQAILEGLAFVPGEEEADFCREYSVTRDGVTRWMRLSLVHNTNKSIGVLQDITDAMMEKKRIEYERDYDGSTGLLNRHAYYRRLAEIFHDPSSLKVTAILMMDLDNLKYVNDTYGHDFGDDYIKTAASALKRFQTYGGVVSRLSGDEFNVCLSGFNSKEEIREIIATVREKLLQSSCLLADGTHFKVRASMGIAWYPDDADSYELLMKYADFAMYTIKHAKKGGVAEFDMDTYAADSVLLTGVEEMNRIIDERSVRYAFQPIVHVRTGEIYGYEALMRPQSKIFQTQLELLRTAKTGAKLYEIERLTWTKALDDFQTQIDAGHIAGDSRIFVNSISNTMLDMDDIEVIEKMHPNLLSQVVLEILESESSNEEFAIRKMGRMRRWNAQVALDDYGINYNSEYVLSTMRPNIVKIDRSITSGCDKDVSRRSIISSLVRLAKTRNILVLAGGVETEDELRAVISCGVDLLQGYYINRPLFEPELPAPEVIELMMYLARQADEQED